MASGKILLVTTVKNEGPNILEWVAHHRLCGFDPIMVFQNDSTDTTVKSLRLLDELGVIQFVNNNRRWGSPQIRAYARASASDAFANAEYCLAIDGDEFFRCDLPGNTVQALLEATDRPDALRLNWQNFGSGGHLGLSDQLVSERYVHSASTETVRLGLEGYKTLFRTDAFARMGVHQARHPKRETGRVVNGSGLEEDGYAWKGWRCSDPGGMSMARIHHYPIRDAVSFLLKRARGSAHQSFRDVGHAYWKRFDVSETEDRTLATRAPAVKAEMMRLDELSGGRLFRLRRRAFQMWRAEFRALLQDEEFKTFFEELKARQAERRPRETAPA